MAFETSAAFALPDDAKQALLVGRVWRPDVGGPSVVVCRGGDLFDISRTVPTVADLFEENEYARIVREAEGERLASIEEVLAATPRDKRQPGRAASARAGRPAGDQGGGRHLRGLDARAGDRGEGARRAGAGGRDPRRDQGDDRRRPRPAEARLGAGDGAEGAAHREGHVVAISRGRHRPGRGDLHQGAADGGGRPPRRGRHPPRCRAGTIPSRRSCWSSPRRGAIVGATLGNDVNLRDFEGRSALLLGKAKDNNASAAIGPFIRLFDRSFSLDDVRQGRGRA